jgi:hypothetical protein
VNIYRGLFILIQICYNTMSCVKQEKYNWKCGKGMSVVWNFPKIILLAFNVRYPDMTYGENQ